jgi:predicted RNase H-like HicB family nuclease
MSVKSRNSVEKIDRPFAPQVLREAKRIAAQYQVVLHCEEGHWYGRGVEMPNVFGDGRTATQCMKDTREALCGAVACLLEQGHSPPAPGRQERRTRQVNVRLSPREKLLLEAGAKRGGFKGLSDFLRAAAMQQSGK